MTESEIIATLVALAKAHPYAAATIALWFVLATGWKAQSKEKRDAWTKAYPRPVSALRFVLELLPDLLGAGRVFVFGILRGMTSRESAPQLSSDPQSPARGAVRETDGVPPSAEQINDDGTPPAQYVPQPRETQAPPPPRESEPGYASSGALAAISGAYFLAIAIYLALSLTGCSARDAIRRNVEPLGLYEVQHPLHGGCHELGVRAQSEALNREVVVYGGVCVGRIDAGAVSDAGVSE